MGELVPISEIPVEESNDGTNEGEVGPSHGSPPK